jgi:serine/threonine protein kinase
VMHTDLRPDNVIITSKGSSKVLDFGMAAWTRGGAARSRAAIDPESLTPDMVRIASYLSPEQALGGVMDARTDVFSLGLILYEMLTGRNPFSARTASGTLTNIVRNPAPSIRALHPELPAEFETMLSRALAKDLDARQESAASLAAELRSIGAVLDIRSGEAPAGELLPLDDEEGGPGKWWLVAVLAIAAVAIGWWLLRG